MSARKIVLIDMDGVLANFDKTCLEEYRRLYPDLPYISLERTAEGPNREGWCDKQYETLFGKEAGDAIYKIFKTEGFFAKIEPLPRAVERVKKLLHDNRFKVFFCTSPLLANPTCASDKCQWISRVFGPQAARKMIITGDKTLVHGDILIDDKAEINGVFKENPKFKTHVLMRCCHNGHVSSEGYKFVLEEDWSNLDSILDEVCEQ